MSKLRIGIVGCGKIAQAHLNGYAQCPEAAIVSVYDLNPAAAEARATATGARVAASLAEMIERDRPEAISVCTPPAAHLENCAPFIAARIPILCEKPLEVDAGRARELCTAVKAAKGLVFMTAFCHRFHPAVIELRRLIDAGTLGEPVLFRNLFGGYGNMTQDHRANPAISGGGCLIDHGCHSMDLFRHLVGDPTAAHAMHGNVAQKMAVEDFGTMQLTVDNRAFGEITCSYSLRVCSNVVEWYGSKGTAIISYFDPTQPDLRYRVMGGSEWVTVDCSAHPDRFTGEIRHFLGCVREGRQPRVTVEDGLKANLIAEAVYASARDGRRTAVAPSR